MRLDWDWTEDVLGDLAQNTMGILPAPICRCATQPGGRPVRFAITFGSYGWNVRGWISPSFRGNKQWQCVQNKSQNWVSTWLKRKKQWARKTRKNPACMCCGWVSVGFSPKKQKVFMGFNLFQPPPMGWKYETQSDTQKLMIHWPPFSQRTQFLDVFGLSLYPFHPFPPYL